MFVAQNTFEQAKTSAAHFFQLQEEAEQKEAEQKTSDIKNAVAGAVVHHPHRAAG